MTVLEEELGKWLPKADNFAKYIMEIKNNHQDLNNIISALQEENGKFRDNNWSLQLRASKAKEDNYKLAKDYDSIMKFCNSNFENFSEQFSKFKHLQKKTKNRDI